ncbi:MAG: hypothetical protein AAF401_11290 [Pseudomonadota bacterium]
MPLDATEVLARAAAYLPVASTDDFLLVCLNITGEDIIDRIDPPQPISKTHTITATGVETYSLPADFVRFQRDDFAVFEESGHERPLTAVSTDGEWQALKAAGSTGAQRFYRLTGVPGAYEINIFSEPASTDTINVNYVSKYWFTNRVGADQAEDGDDLESNGEVRLPRRILEVGTIWRWKEDKGYDFQPQYQEYEALMARLDNDGRLHRNIGFGGRTTRSFADVPVPDFIPSA